MRWVNPLLLAGESLVDRLLCVAGAVIFSQAPEFMQQYLQRLGGHLAEARRHLGSFEEIARGAGKSLEQLSTDYAANADSSVVALGRLIRATGTRVDILGAAETSIRHASAWERPFVFIRHLDSDIARATAEIFKPAVPTTLEGLLYAFTGVVVILGIYRGLIRPLAAKAFTSSERAKPASA